MKEPWVSVSGIGHSDIRGLGKECFPYRQVNGPPRVLPSVRVDHKTERISEMCQHSYIVDSSNLTIQSSFKMPSGETVWLLAALSYPLSQRDGGVKVKAASAVRSSLDAGNPL